MSIEIGLKTFALALKIELTDAEFEAMFYPDSNFWTVAINSKKALENNFFETVYKVKPVSRSLENVGSVIIDNDRSYIRVYSIDALKKQERSFYIFIKDNVEYMTIHFDNYSTPYERESFLFTNEVWFVNRKWENENGIITSKIDGKNIAERIQEINNADIEGNALNFETIQTNEMTVTLLNHDGLLDNFDNFYGNNFSVYKIYDGESFDKAKIIYSGFIQKPEYNYLDTVTITAGDMRYTFSNTLTSKVFNLKDYPYLEKFPENVKSGHDIVDKPRTIAAGKGVVIELTPIKYDTVSSTPEVVFEICDTSRHAIERIVNKADVLDNNKIKPHVWFIEKGEKDSTISSGGKVISGDLEIFIPSNLYTLDKNKGTLTFRGANNIQSITDTSDNLYQIFIEVDIPPYKSLELLKECFAEYENIEYIKENYDIENWTKAEAQSKEIAIVINSENDLTMLDLIGKVSFLEQGRLEIVNNKITFNSTNNRVVKYSFKQSKMGRVDKTVDNAEYLSTCSIIYDLGNLTYKNTDYEDEAKKRHRLNVHEEFETVLKNKSDAVELSNKIMEARHILKDYITFEYFETLDELQLFDLVEFSYKRDNLSYYIKPCVCEILKLNVFDNVIKLRKVRDV